MLTVLFHRSLVRKCIMKYPIKSCLAAVGMLALVGQAHAAILTVQLTQADPSAGLGAGPFGTVTVTDIVGGVTVDVTLSSGEKFVNTGGPHTPFAYNLNLQPTSFTG